MKFSALKGITLPVPPSLETLEEKMPSKALQNPLTMDFLKVNTSEANLISRSGSYKNNYYILFYLEMFG